MDAHSDAHSLAAALRALIRPGDRIWWGQATAEPLTLTRALVAHRHAIAQGGRLGVFVGIGQSDTLQPDQPGQVRVMARHAAGGRGAGAGLPRRCGGPP